MVNIILIIILLILPVKVFAVLPVVDAQAGFNSWLERAEQHVQTLKMVQMIIDIKNNYETAKMAYALAKSGFEKAFDRDEWNALLEYHKYKLNQMANPEADAYDSSLYRTLESLNDYLDEYGKNTRLYSNVNSLFSKVGNAVDNADSSMANGVLEHTPLGDYYALNDKLSGKTADLRSKNEFNLAQKYLEDETTKSGQVLTMAGDKMTRAKKLLDESEMLKKMLFYAERDYATASERLSQDIGSEPLKKEAHLKFERTKQVLDDIKHRRAEIQNELKLLADEVRELNEQIAERNMNLKNSAAAIGIEKVAQDITYNKGLSTGAGRENIVAGVQKSVLFILTISMALALLLSGIKSSQGGELIPYDVIIGFIWAVVFLAPASPVNIKNIAKELSILVDTSETTIYKNTMKEAGVRFEQNFPFARTVSALIHKDENASTPAVKDVPMAQQLMAIGSGKMIDMILQPVVLLLSLLGVATLMIAMSIRIGLYWILMAIAPILIALAPLPYARKTLIPRWGTSLLSIILWGPIAKTILVVCQEILTSTTGAYQNLLTSNSAYGYLTTSMEGLLTMVLMVISPFIAYSLASASYDGMVGGLIGTGAMAAGAIANPAMALGSAATQKAGAMTQSLGFKMGNSQSSAFRNIGKTISSFGTGMEKVGAKIGNHKINITPHSVSLTPRQGKLFQNKEKTNDQPKDLVSQGKK